MAEWHSPSRQPRVGTPGQREPYDPVVVGHDSFEVSASLLRRGSDLPTMVDSLSTRLARALPDHVEVSRSHLRKRCALIVDLEPERFRLELRGHRVEVWVDHVVREVCIRSEVADFDAWIERLAAALEREATKNTALRLALEDALS